MKQDSEQTTHYLTYGAWGRAAVAAAGVLAAVGFVGLFRRTEFVWRCALIGIPIYGAVLTAGMAGLMRLMPHPERTETMYWLSVALYAVLFGLMTAWQTALWYKQKDNFLRKKSDGAQLDH